MKKFIRYLYEYQNGKRVQNAGFVRVEESADSAVIQIYGKGFPAAGNQTLEILLFRRGVQSPADRRGGEDGACVGISMGMVKGASPMFGYRLAYDSDDVHGPENFRNLDGLILVSNVGGYRRWYGAVWDERPVDIENMVRWEEPPKEAAPVEEESPKEETEPEKGKVPEENEVPAEVPMAERVPAEEEVTEAEKAPAEENVSVEEKAPEAEKATVEEESLAAEKAPAEEESGDILYKITRRDIARLPRKEWKLANNNFLLHGYHNYHHLVSFYKEGKCWLGVPGIYHPREQRAAGAFGFSQFMKPEEGEIELSEDERNEQEEFGYWCRVVSAVIADPGAK